MNYNDIPYVLEQLTRLTEIAWMDEKSFFQINWDLDEIHKKERICGYICLDKLKQNLDFKQSIEKYLIEYVLIVRELRQKNVEINYPRLPLRYEMHDLQKLIKYYENFNPII